MTYTNTAKTSTTWLRNQTEMAQRICAFDWSKTPVGSINAWPATLRTCVSLMLNTQQPVYIAWGPELLSLYNDAMIPILDIKHPQGLAKPFADLWREVWDEVRPMAEAAMAGKPQYFTERAVAVTINNVRTINYFNFSWTPITDNNGNVAGFYVAGINITEQILRNSYNQKPSVSINEIEDRYSTLFKLATFATALTEMPSGKLVEVNDAFTELFGYSREEVLGKTSIELGLTSAESQAQVREEFTRHGHVRDLECVRRTRTGVPRIVIINISPITVGGKPYVLSTLQDITERQLMQQQLHLALEKLDVARQEAIHANEAKTRFLASSSHDLRQPLSAISLYVDMLKKQADPRTQPIIDRMRESVRDLRDLITDLLDLSRFDAAVIKPSSSEFVMDDVFYSIETIFSPIAKSRGLKFHIRPCGHLVQTDELLYRRIISNLVSNAIRYTDKGGILIACRLKNGRHWIEVWDTGVGIPNDKLQFIFQEYQQIPPTTNNPRPQGSGLGLAIVDRAAKLLGLEIRVRSIPGKGTVFAIEMPIMATPIETREVMEMQ